MASSEYTDSSISNKPMRVFSFGGGVQSTACLILQAEQRLPNPQDVFVFANVGADSENPKTLEYLETVTKPYAARHGIQFVEVWKTRADGTQETLLERIMGEQKSVVIPAYTTDAKGRVRRLHRNCTTDFKIAVVDKWTKEQGATHSITALGISLDEFQRVRDTDWHEENGLIKRRDYPLIDLRLTREQCKDIIERAGLPEPVKSACKYCPFTGWLEWHYLKRNTPEIFEEAIVVDRRVREKESSVQGRVSIHRSGTPLENAVGEQAPMFPDNDDDNCTESCMT